MRISVAYAAAPESGGNQFWQEFDVAEDATVLNAIDASGVLDRYRDIDLARSKVGIYGRFVTLTTRLSDGDRVEIYRLLPVKDEDDEDDDD